MTQTAEKPTPKSARFDLSAFGIEVEAAQDTTDKWTMLVYGQKGVGKTSLAADCANVPEWAPVLFIATEHGTNVLGHKYKDNPNLGVVTVNNWPDFLHVVLSVTGAQWKKDPKTQGGGNDLLVFPKEPPTPIRTIVIDTFPQAQKLAKKYTKETGFGMWGFVAESSEDLADLLQRCPFINVIYTSHTEKVKDDDSGKLLMNPHFIGNKSLIEVLKPIDHVFYLAKAIGDDGKPLRVLQTDSDGKIVASNRGGGRLDFQIQNPTMTEIHRQLSK